MVKIGCCIPGKPFTPPDAKIAPESTVEQIVAKCRYLLDCGFDFTEFTAVGIANLSEEEFEQLAAENQKDSLRIRAVNSLFPSTFTLSDPDNQWDEIIAYIHKVIDRLARLEIQYAVFGSGGARRIPDSMDRQTGLQNLRRVMNAFADYAEPKGVTMVIEPLRQKESNVFNLVLECDKEVRLLNRPGVRLLADSFHMLSEGSPAEDVKECADTLRHCHIAEGFDRLLPGFFNTGDPNYNKQFADALNQINYSDGVSIECIQPDYILEVTKALAYLRSIF